MYPFISFLVEIKFAAVKKKGGFLKKDFTNMIMEFHHRGRLNKEVNATFLTLISKVSNPVEFQDYRP